MPGDDTPEPPTRRRRAIAGEGVELGTGDIGMRVELRFDLVELDREGGDKANLVGIVAHDIGAADIGFPIVEHRPEIEEYQIVLGDRQHRRVFARGGEAIDPGMPAS